MTKRALTRRRFIAISAAGAGSLLAGPTTAGSGFQWRGVVLGASASIRIDGQTPDGSDQLVHSCIHEIRRLEAIFSLYRADSELSRLNRDGRLAQPSADFLSLLSMAQGVHHSTTGAFDPTIQPLWELYAQHFRAQATFRQSGPSPEDIMEMQRRTGLEKVVAGPEEIRFAEPRMAITLNGVAQGYITDRIAELLRSYGLSHVLVHIGETRAVGAREDGNPWKVLVPSSRAEEPGRTVGLTDAAMATSATSGTTFDDTGQFGHIIDPRTGRPPEHHKQVTVIGASAALADAYSTAFCLLSEDMSASIAKDTGYSLL